MSFVALGGIFILYDQTHLLHAATVLHTGGNDIDPGGIDAAVTQDIRQPCNVFLQSIKNSRKQMSEIMRKDLS